MNDKEVAFCSYFEAQILPNRNKVNTDMIRHAASLIGYQANLTCRTCLHDSAVDLLNMYNRMLPAWNEHKKIVEKQRIAEDLERLAEEKRIEKQKKQIKKTNEN